MRESQTVQIGQLKGRDVRVSTSNVMYVQVYVSSALSASGVAGWQHVTCHKNLRSALRVVRRILKDCPEKKLRHVRVVIESKKVTTSVHRIVSLKHAKKTLPSFLIW